MSKSVFVKPYAKQEYNFQARLRNTATYHNLGFFTGDNDIEIRIKGDIFKKTVATGGAIEMRVEFWEIDGIPAGGLTYNEIFAVPKNREDPIFDSFMTVNFGLAYTPSPNKIMMREYGVADKVSVERKMDLDLNYSLKRNTWYSFRSTITGSVYDAEAVVIGEIAII